MIKRFLLGNPCQKDKAAYLWNTASGLIMAGQSVVLLIAITHICDIRTAGIFSIAYAIASLMLTIGKYGMRPYQVSDVSFHDTFQDYLTSRVVTTAAMMIISIGYAVIGIYTTGYDTEKVIIIILLCMQKSIEAFEDVYYGSYQRMGRLDVAARAMTIRLAFTVLVMIIVLLITRSLIWATLISTVLSIGICWWFLGLTYPEIREPASKGSTSSFMGLLKACLPLFLGGYLSIYIGNISKYAIDQYMNEEVQACYNFIFMPVFVIGLLSSFLYQPLMGKMAMLWKQKDNVHFFRIIFKQLGAIVIITLVCLAGAWILGIPVLSAIYNTDLTEYKISLEILLTGGGLYAAAALMTVVLTVIRHQNSVVIGYAVVAIVAKLFSKDFIVRQGIKGAAWLYLISMGCAFIIFCIEFLYYIYKRKKGRDC